MVEETGDGFGHRSKADHLRRSHECGAVKRLVRRAVPAQDGNRPQDLIPTGCIQLGWRREAERPAFALVKVGLWAWLDLNQRPHPYQGPAPGPVSAGSRLQPARTTYRWRLLETAADRSVPMACEPDVDQGSPPPRSQACP